MATKQNSHIRPNIKKLQMSFNEHKMASFFTCYANYNFALNNEEGVAKQKYIFFTERTFNFFLWRQSIIFT